MDDIKDLVQWEVKHNFALLQQLSASITAMASATQNGPSFPNFTVPYFEISAGYTDGMGGIMSTAYAPLVVDRFAWEEYSVQHQDWLAESARLKVAHPFHLDPVNNTMQDHEYRRKLDWNASISENIFRWDDGAKVIVDGPSQDGLDVFAPLWQVSPPDSEPINVDLFSDSQLWTMFSIVQATNQTVQSGTVEVGDTFDFYFDDDEKIHKTDGHTIIMHPVFDSFGNGQKLVGILAALASLDHLLSSILPEDVKGINAVFEDTCGDVRTYELNALGRRARQIGLGDLHDPYFESYKISFDLVDYDTADERLCLHTLKLYPSVRLRQRYDSKRTALYKCLAVGAGFAVLLILVGIYDRKMSERQRKAARSAKKSSALLDSLFPKAIQERILKEDAAVDHDVEEGSKEKSQPIADFFPNASLMCTSHFFCVEIN